MINSNILNYKMQLLGWSSVVLLIPPFYMKVNDLQIYLWKCSQVWTTNQPLAINEAISLRRLYLSGLDVYWISGVCLSASVHGWVCFWGRITQSFPAVVHIRWPAVPALWRGWSPLLSAVADWWKNNIHLDSKSISSVMKGINVRLILQQLERGQF